MRSLSTCLPPVVVFKKKKKGGALTQHNRRMKDTGKDKVSFVLSEGSPFGMLHGSLSDPAFLQLKIII